MDYNNFRSLWHETLKSTHLATTHPLCPNETIDTRTMDRSYSLFIQWQRKSQRDDKFHVTAHLRWRWDALLSARFSTTEEDMLMQIYGDFDIHEDTEQPWLRVDVTLHATMPYGQPMPLPYQNSWFNWVRAVQSQVSPFLWAADDGETRDDSEIPSWCGTPEAEFHCEPTGEIFLKGVNLSAFRGINLPRQWDHPDKWDEQPEKQLVDFFQRVKSALAAWEDCLRFLI